MKEAILIPWEFAQSTPMLKTCDGMAQKQIKLLGTLLYTTMVVAIAKKMTSKSCFIDFLD